MRRSVVFALGLIVGSWAYPGGLLLGARLHHRNLIDPVEPARPLEETL